MTGRFLSRLPAPTTYGLTGLVALLLLLGCGRMGDPIPPEHVRLNPPTELTALGRAKTLTLAWKAPSQRADGQTAVAITGYLIERDGVSPDEACEGCPPSYKTAGHVDVEKRDVHGKRSTVWVDEKIKSHWVYDYRVTALDHRGRPGTASEPLRVTALIPAPPSVLVTGRDQAAHLNVTPPTPVPNSEPLGLYVYGANNQLLSRFAPDQTEGTIPDLANDAAILLRVHWAITEPGGQSWESVPVEFSVTPADDNPPEPPSELVALADTGGIFIRWMPARGERYGAVLLFRAADDGPMEKIAQLGGNVLSYLDPDVLAGKTYRYAAKAMDRARNTSGLSSETTLSLPGSSP